MSGQKEDSMWKNSRIVIRNSAFLAAAVSGLVELFFGFTRIRFHTPLFVLSLMIFALAIMCGGLLIYVEKSIIGGILAIAFSLGYNFIVTEEWKYGIWVFYGIPLVIGILGGILGILLGLVRYAERRRMLRNESK